MPSFASASPAFPSPISARASSRFMVWISLASPDRLTPASDAAISSARNPPTLAPIRLAAFAFASIALAPLIAAAAMPPNAAAATPATAINCARAAFRLFCASVKPRENCALSSPRLTRNAPITLCAISIRLIHIDRYVPASCHL